MTTTVAVVTGADAARRPHLRALTGLRFLAAFHVVVYHFGQPLLKEAPSPLRSLAGCGYVSVSLFFLLSGFILAYTYLPESGPARVDPRRFWTARFARIYPVYLVGFILAAPHVVKTLVGEHGLAGGALRALGHGAAALGLVQAWSPHTAIVWNVPAWSLSVEAFFYLLFPMLLAPAVRAARPARLGVALAGLWAAALAPPLVYLALNPDGLTAPAGPDTRGVWLETLKYSPLARLPEFALGVILGAWHVRSGDAGRGGGALSVGAAAAVLAPMAAARSLPYPLLHNGLLAPLFAALIVGLARGGGPVHALLGTRPLVLLGEASYALYILHLHGHPWTQRLLRLVDKDAARDPAAAFWFYAVAITAASVAVFLWIETPARRWLRHRLSPRAPA